MLLYDQVLSWGNSVVALGVNLCWRWLDVPGTGLGGADDVSPFAGAVITLGLEAGRDVLPAQLRGDPHAEATVHLAANAGLLLSLGLGCLLLTALMAATATSANASPSSTSSSPSSSSSSSSGSSSSEARESAETGCQCDDEKDATASTFPVMHSSIIEMLVNIRSDFFVFRVLLLLGSYSLKLSSLCLLRFGCGKCF